MVHVAVAGAVVHAPPFEVVAIDVTQVFGDDEPAPEEAPPTGG